LIIYCLLIIISLVCKVINLDFELVFLLDLLKSLLHIELLRPGFVSFEHFRSFDIKAQFVEVLFYCFFS